MCFDIAGMNRFYVIFVRDFCTIMFTREYVKLVQKERACAGDKAMCSYVKKCPLASWKERRFLDTCHVFPFVDLDLICCRLFHLLSSK